MSTVTNLLEKNPMVTAFVLGIIVTLIVVVILYQLFKERIGKQTESRLAQEMVYLHGVTSTPPTDLGKSEKATSNPNRSLPDEPRQFLGGSNREGDPRFALMTDGPTEGFNPFQLKPAEEEDKDDKAMELLQSRGTAHRPIGDSARSRYLGLTTLGARDYEGYRWEGEPVSDEVGGLIGKVWGIDATTD